MSPLVPVACRYKYLTIVCPLTVVLSALVVAPLFPHNPQLEQT
jgi:hypothetical protein